MVGPWELYRKHAGSGGWQLAYRKTLGFVWVWAGPGSGRRASHILWHFQMPVTFILYNVYWVWKACGEIW